MKELSKTQVGGRFLPPDFIYPGVINAMTETCHFVKEQVAPNAGCSFHTPLFNTLDKTHSMLTTDALTNTIIFKFDIFSSNVLLDVDFTDLSFSMHDAAFWSVAEPAIAIINCCIATLRPLLKLISPACLWTSNKPNTSYHAGYSGGIGSGNKLRANIGVEHDEYPLTCVEHEVADTVSACGKHEGSLGVKGDAESEKTDRNVSTADSVLN
jgi:hypothetical protein